jgi:hypothetical protein
MSQVEILSGSMAMLNIVKGGSKARENSSYSSPSSSSPSYDPSCWRPFDEHTNKLRMTVSNNRVKKGVAAEEFANKWFKEEKDMGVGPGVGMGKEQVRETFLRRTKERRHHGDSCEYHFFIK